MWLFISLTKGDRMVTEYPKRALSTAIAVGLASVIFAALFMLQSIVPLSYADITAPNVIASASVPLSCAISLNTFAISFGTINPSTNTLTTSKNVLDTNGGNQGTFIAVYGTSWIGGASSFVVGQTTWSSSSATGYGSGTALTASPTNTAIAVGTASSASIWFGVGVPSGQAANTYTQNVVILNVC